MNRRIYRKRRINIYYILNRALIVIAAILGIVGIVMCVGWEGAMKQDLSTSWTYPVIGIVCAGISASILKFLYD